MIFEFFDYRKFLRSYVKSRPRNGRGELTRICERLSIPTSLMSQILAGSRELTLEQGLALSKYLGHTELETDYLESLILLERASTEDLRKRVRARIEKLKRDGLLLGKRMAVAKELSEEQLATFCSAWTYSAIHLLTSLTAHGKDGLTVDEIAQKLKMDRPKVSEQLSFLCHAGLCVQEGDRYVMGGQSTFVKRESPHLARLHSNWRIKAIHDFEKRSEEDFMTTAQVSLSRKDFLVIREKLLEVIKFASERVKDSAPEDVAFLNIDWFCLR